jgi:hypothetical protein
MAHTSSKPAPISQLGAKMCSRLTRFTAMLEIPCRSHLRREPTTPMGCRSPLPQTLTATISDNSAAMFVAKCTTGSLKLFARYENVRYMAPSNPQTVLRISRETLFARPVPRSTTRILTTAFGVNGLANKALQVMWPGSKYAVTENLDRAAGDLISYGDRTTCDVRLESLRV